jgi:hypothetical protein
MDFYLATKMHHTIIITDYFFISRFTNLLILVSAMEDISLCKTTIIFAFCETGDDLRPAQTGDSIVTNDYSPKVLL